jgi:glycosyltransferase involved in cell wall biosynthesis
VQLSHLSQNARHDLTIVSTVHNAGKFLDLGLEQIEKVRKLNYKMVIVDDASTDKTVSSLRKICDGKQIKLLELTENVGSAEARNIGMKYVRSKYVWFIDFDDEINVEVLNINQELKEMSYLVADAKVFNFSWRQFSDRSIPEEIPHLCSDPKNPPFFGRDELFSISNWPLGIWRMIFRTKFLTDNQVFWRPTYQDLGPGKRYLEDVFFFAKFLSFNPKVVKSESNLPIYSYHIRDSYTKREEEEQGNEEKSVLVLLEMLKTERLKTSFFIQALLSKLVWNPPVMPTRVEISRLVTRMRYSRKALQSSTTRKYWLLGQLVSNSSRYFVVIVIRKILQLLKVKQVRMSRHEFYIRMAKEDFLKSERQKSKLK